MDFSIIAQDPTTRAFVQDGLLERAFHDALFPNQIFRGMVEAVQWVGHTGDSAIFTGEGLYTPNLQPIRPGVDPVPQSAPKEQWSATLQRYAWTTDTPMATSAVSIVDLFYKDAKRIGMQAAQSLDRMVRNRMYNAAEAGNTVLDGAQNSNTLRVKRLNGFTRARRPDLAAGSAVQFAPVSSSNPLPIILGAATARNVTGFTPDNAGDEYGPGTITIDGAAYNGADRDAVRAVNRSTVTWVGGGTKVDDIGNTDLLTLAAIRSCISNLRQNNVPVFPDGKYYAHIDPVAEGQVYGDQEVQRLNVSLPDYHMYADFAIGSLLGTVFLRNNSCPVVSTVYDGSGGGYTLKDPFAGELWNTGVSTGVPLHRTLIGGAGGIMEYWLDANLLLSDAGLQGKSVEPRITNNSIEVLTDRVTLIIRSPQNRTGDLPATTAVIHADWPVRTDVCTGDASAFKRFREIVSGEA